MNKLRRIMRTPTIVLAIVLLAATGGFAQQGPLPGSAIPQFVDPLPGLDLIAAGTDQIVREMEEFQAPVLSTGTVLPGPNPSATWVWGYLQPGQTGRASYIGPVIVATRGTPTEVKYVDNLGDAATTNVLACKNSTAQTLHRADPLNGGAKNAQSLPSVVNAAAARISPPIAKTEQLALSMGQGRGCINGVCFNVVNGEMVAHEIHSELGAYEIWQITNNSGRDHPFTGT